MRKYANKIGEWLIVLGKSLCDSKSETEFQVSISSDEKKSEVSVIETSDESLEENNDEHMPKSDNSVCNNWENPNKDCSSNGKGSYVQKERNAKGRHNGKKQYKKPCEEIEKLQNENQNLRKQLEKLKSENEGLKTQLKNLKMNGLSEDESNANLSKNVDDDIQEDEKKTLSVPESVIKYYFPYEIDDSGSFNSISMESENGAYVAEKNGGKNFKFTIYNLERVKSNSTDDSVQQVGIVEKKEATDFETVEKGVVEERGSDDEKYWKIIEKAKIRYKK